MPGPKRLILHSKATGGLLKVAGAVLLLAGNSFTGYYIQESNVLCTCNLSAL